MDFKLPIKNRKLDFNRETFNEPLIRLPTEENSLFKVPETRTSSNSFADDEESVNSFASNTTTTATITNESEKVSVYLRVRPIQTNDLPTNQYKFNLAENKVIIPQPSTHSSSKEKHFSFTSILERVNQVEIYDKIVRPVLNSPFSIPGATFASYGCSNSGKTYTILGDSCAGLVPRAITQLFTQYASEISLYPCVKIVNDSTIDAITDEEVNAEMEMTEEFIYESRNIKGKSHPWNYEKIIEEHNFVQDEEDSIKYNRIFIWVSMVEIYNEKLSDLFSMQAGTTTTRPLKIYSNDGRSYIQNVTWLYVSDIKQAFEVLHNGLNKISYASTGINAHSSRSHTIFTMNVVAELMCGSEFQITTFKFCDLAGAERLKKTGNVGERLKEAGVINTSLLVLGRCLEAVNQNQKAKKEKKKQKEVVPVRDSKLTLLLKSSLLGREKFAMIVNICPSADFFDENLNVLKFGSIANEIVVKKGALQKHRRRSIRYSFFHNDTLNTSKKNSVSILNNSSFAEESELDDSFIWKKLPTEELIHNLRLQKMEIDCLKHTLEERERESIVRERELRREIVEAQDKLREKLALRHEESEELLKSYHEKKLESQKIRYERQLNSAYDEIKTLEKIIKKLKLKSGNDIISENEEDDEIYEIDDEDEEDSD